MKFGKQIQSQQIPGWSAYYLDYKFLKKIISSLAAHRPASEAAALALGVRPADILNAPANSLSQVRSPISPSIHSILQEDGPGQPPIFSAAQDNDRDPDVQAHKAAFFFKLERELEKINTFYLQKEAELKLRLETLLSKRRAAAMRGLPDNVDDTTLNHVEWSAVEEGFRLLERDLGKLQQYVEINALGFRKILKKWDKRSRSTTKELYLARQVDVQPVFNRQLISELSDTVALCLLDLTDLSTGLKFEGAAAQDFVTQQLSMERHSYTGPFHDLEHDLRKAVEKADESAIQDLVRYSDVLGQQNGGRINVIRILWKVIVEAPPDLADLILRSVVTPFDFDFVDDINGRTCLHQAAAAGALRLVNMCLEKASQQDEVDVYGRSALHYAAMYGHAAVCQRLLEVRTPAYTLDKDNCNALVYATLKGSAECIKVLLQDEALVLQSIASTGDLVPLSLASQYGHVDVVLLLLQHGAKNLPNSNGEYPIHLAAREGHAQVCKLLLDYPGWDTPDKYHEWTPLFHAARYGHYGCVDVLLQAGCRVDVFDEVGHLAVHYAAWHGHRQCTERLLVVSPKALVRSGTPSFGDVSPLSDVDRQTESDIDMIPSLSLPPPIMPHRVYGHNYLDKAALVEVTIGRPSTRNGKSSGLAVKLHPRLSNSIYHDHHPSSSTPLKLVLTAGPHVNAAPYSIALPQRNEQDVFVFQAPSLSTLYLEFSVCPNFGTKTIGRGVMLASMLSTFESSQSHVLPILDTRLHVIGEVVFDINITTSFQGVTLEVGGAVETYWKSMAVPIQRPLPPLRTNISWRQSPRSLDSTHTSPSNASHATSSLHALTISSLTGEYIYAVVQVTRDFHPVIWNDWLLPESGFELGVSDVTLAQFEALADRLGRGESQITNAMDPHWQQLLSRSMISLAQLMKIMPIHLGVTLELAYPSRRIRESKSIRHHLDLNECVDSVLRTIYHTSASLGPPYARRRLSFVSFSPRICAALNWKQPNYPVFFASQCGQQSKSLPSLTAMSLEDMGDEMSHWSSSVGLGVEFAKMNNLLGVFFDGELLLQVPSLIEGIRDAGLLVGIFGIVEDSGFSSPNTLAESHVDALILDGAVIYTDHSTQEML